MLSYWEKSVKKKVNTKYPIIIFNTYTDEYGWVWMDIPSLRNSCIVKKRIKNCCVSNKYPILIYNTYRDEYGWVWMDILCYRNS